MKASELRIGNYLVFSPKPGKAINQRFVKVIEINEKDFIVLDKGLRLSFNYESENITPAAITDVILETAAFKKDNEFDHLFRFGQFDIEFCYGAWHWTVDDRGDNEGTKPRVVEYVHQLQNILFCISGEELKFQL